MAADLDGPAITGTAVIEHKVRQIGVMLHKMRIVVRGMRNRMLDGTTADALDTGLEAVRIDLAAIHRDTQEQLRLGAEALEAAQGVLKAIGAEGRLKPREPQPEHFDCRCAEPQPAGFEGCYVPEPERPEYLADMARPTNVVILANVRRSRPEGGGR